MKFRHLQPVLFRRVRKRRKSKNNPEGVPEITWIRGIVVGWMSSTDGKKTYARIQAGKGKIFNVEAADIKTNE